MRRILALVSLFVLASCGQDTSSSYTRTEDTVEIESPVSFVSSTRLSILEPERTAMSEKLRPCEISFGEDTLNFRVVSDSELSINDQTFMLARPLAEAVTAPQGVDRRLFAVWVLPARTITEVTQTIEVEIQDQKIIYRNTCSI